LTPAELIPALDRGELPGISHAETFEDGDEWARIYRVEPSSVRANPSEIALHLSPAAALAWLDLAGGPPGGDAAIAAVSRLATAGAVVVGPEREPLARRLSGVACIVPIAEATPEAGRILPVGPGCPAG
jgi:hypothetical protein